MSVLVWIETFEGSMNPSSREALAAARGLSSTVTAAVFGKNAAAIAAEAAQYGATAAVVCDDATLHDYRLEPYAALLTKLVQEHKPAVVLAVATAAGRELLSASAADVDAGILSDVVELTLNGDELHAVKPAYAGKIISKLAIKSGTKFVTLRGRAFKPLDADPAASVSPVAVAPVLSEAQIPVKIEAFEKESGKVSLNDAAIIVSGGRGIANNPKAAPADAGDAAIWKAKDGFASVLQPLVDTLGGALGASRAAVDAGFIPYEYQVGQTGKNVNPDLYIACAISGAIQHQAGMRNSKLIVAINKDGEAPIFKLARYGVVEDMYAFVPVLTAELKKRLGK
ncbi:MAG: electron transfer flavoprotein subunit alpha/FixB family protein [Anaerolineae bacterium]|jgi:electron transfer flavoprotein alpha subunit|nr:electron transfer flavoprotein subunit alpha/FixB family protein [Anaerolineae bacterium]